MTPAREQLLARYLEGSLSPEDEAALLEILEKDPVAVAELEALLRQDEGMRQAFVPEASPEALARAVVERLNGSGRTDQFTKVVVERLRSETPKTGTRSIRRLRLRQFAKAGPPAWVAGVAAAAAFFALLVLATVAMSKRNPPQKPPPDVANPEEAPQSEARSQRTPEVPPRRVPPREEQREPKPLELPPRPPAPSPLPEATRLPESVPPAQPVSPSEPRPPVTTAEAAPIIAWLDGEGIKAGHEFEASREAVLTFKDGTKVVAAPGTKIQKIQEADASAKTGKRFVVDRGTVTAQVAPQPKGLPMVLATPHGEARVQGTTLRLIVDATTRLEVTEGVVRLVRKTDLNSVDVKAGQRSEIVRVNRELQAQPLPVEEILLLAKDSLPPSNGDWQKLPDKNVFGGVVLHALQEWNGMKKTAAQTLKDSPGYVEFAFHADAGKEYSLWMHGECTSRKSGKGVERERFDYAALQFETAHEVSSVHLPIAESRAYQFNGWGTREGFWWIGGDADSLLDEDRPLTVKFARSGRQVLRVYPIESPMRFDAIWLSATQKTRPRPDQRGPEKK